MRMVRCVLCFRTLPGAHGSAGPPDLGALALWLHGARHYAGSNTKRNCGFCCICERVEKVASSCKSGTGRDSLRGSSVVILGTPLVSFRERLTLRCPSVPRPHEERSPCRCRRLTTSVV